MNGTTTDVSSAQNLEDVRLWRVLHDCASPFYVDVGANHPTRGSVSRWFSDRGWTGINIEPGPEFPALSADRPQDVNLNIAIGPTEGTCTLFVPLVATTRASVRRENVTGDPVLRHLDPTNAVTELVVPQRRLESVLTEHAADRAIALLVIDVEGAERDVIASNDWRRFRPFVVVVEAVDPVGISLTPNHEGWEPLLFEAGYQLVQFDGINRYYVADERPELRDRFPFDHFASWVERVEALADENAVIRARADGLAAQVEELAAQVEGLRRSKSYRVGHAVLTPLRRMRRFRPAR